MTTLVPRMAAVPSIVKTGGTSEVIATNLIIDLATTHAMIEPPRPVTTASVTTFRPKDAQVYDAAEADATAIPTRASPLAIAASTPNTTRPTPIPARLKILA